MLIGGKQPGVDEVVGVGRRDVDDVDGVRTAVLDESERVTAQLLVTDVHLVAGDEPEEFFPGHVERERHRMGHGKRNIRAAIGTCDGRFEDRGRVVVVHVRQPDVRRDDTLGLPGGARGVDEVGRMAQAIGARGEGTELVVAQSTRRRVGHAGDHVGISESDDVAATLGGRGRERGPTDVGEQDRGFGVVDDRREPLHRVLALERKIRRAATQHREQRHHHVDRPRQVERHDPLRTGAMGEEETRHAVDARVEFGVGHPFITGDHRDGVTTSCRLIGEEFSDGQRLEIVVGDVPVGLEGRLLGRGDQGDRTDGAVGVGDERTEDGGQPGQHRVREPGVDRRGPVLELDAHRLPGRQHPGDREVRGVGVVDPGDALRAFEIGERVVVEEVLQHEQRVEQRCVSGDSLHLAQTHVVVRHRRHTLVGDATDDVGDGPRRRQVDTRRDGVQEQTDGLLDADQFAGSPRDRRAEHHVRGARMVAGDDGERRGQHGVVGDPESIGGGVDRSGQLRGDLGEDLQWCGIRGVPPWIRRARARHEGGFCDIGQDVRPRSTRGGGIDLVQPPQIVGERCRPRRRARRVASGPGGVVEREQITQHEFARPAVEQQEVVGQQQSVGAVREVDDAEPDQWRRLEVERCGAVGVDDRTQARGRVVRGREVVDADVNRRIPGDDRDQRRLGLCVGVGVGVDGPETCSQLWVPVQQGRKRRAHGADVETVVDGERVLRDVGGVLVGAV
ncbi:hypothetical protein GCM10007298_07050 [Williamsia phyllosphaerae]|uniref:Uncharacterized protein n=1 Tax=Williamsia phyllosphaerae TaxID=885042 RepID=A0ABQ1UBB7_9NOCA|nr:hypothetical protein GCM10007298_07050 [Williamsia phyllosphaerae]